MTSLRASDIVAARPPDKPANAVSAAAEVRAVTSCPTASAYDAIGPLYLLY